MAYSNPPPEAERATPKSLERYGPGIDLWWCAGVMAVMNSSTTAPMRILKKSTS
jgi:hypothetical protein